MPNSILTDKKYDLIDAQLSEIIWHTFTLDSRIKEMSTERYNKILQLDDKYNLNLSNKSRTLEIAANNHFTSYLLSEKFQCQSVLVDISQEALKSGREIAKKYLAPNTLERVQAVACDFHHLPFESASFDFIFISHAIHHTHRCDVLLKEIFRTLKPTGHLLITEEPVARKVCTYQFNVNRKETFTPFEKTLFESGILNLVAYPSAPHGSRPEEIFGVIENYKIPFSFFETIHSWSNSLLEEWCAPSEDWLQKNCFDRWLLNLLANVKDNELVLRMISERLHGELSNANSLFNEQCKLMGFSKVDTDSILNSVAPNLDSLRKIADTQNIIFSRNHIDLLGGMYGCLLKGSKINTSIKSTTNVVAFDPSDTVSQVFLASGYDFINLEKKTFPDIQNAPLDSIRSFFPDTDWQIITDPYNIRSCVNKTASFSTLPIVNPDKGVLLCRYYAVFNDIPYNIHLKIDNKIVATHTICASESRLFKLYIDSLAGPITFSLEQTSGSEESLTNNVLVGVLQFYNIQDSENSETSKALFKN